MKNIWVLYSDSCNESYEIKRLKDVSLANDINIEVFEPSDFEIILNNDKDGMYVKGIKRELPDYFFPRLGSSTSYFGFTIIREFERLNVPVINSSDSISMVKDKLHCQQVLAKNGLPTVVNIIL